MKTTFRAGAGVTAVVFAGFVAACGGSNTVHTRIVRDSAGIEIVELSLASATELQLSDSPIAEAEPGEAGDVSLVTDATILGNGSIAVVSAGTHQLMIFDSDGGLTGMHGRHGGGPGEFEFPERVFELAPNRVLVSDPQLARLSIFDQTCTLIDEAPLPVSGFRNVVSGFIGGNRIVIGHLTFELSPTDLVPQIMHYEQFDWVTGGTTPISQVSSGSIGHVGAGEPWGAVRGPLFDPSAQATTRDGIAIVGDALAAELRFHDPTTGRLIRILRWDGESSKVDGVEVAIHREQVLDRMPNAEYRALMLKHLNATPVCERFPFFGEVRTDRVGRVWVQQYVKPSDEGQVWYVFDLDEMIVLRAQLARNMTCMDATVEHLLILERDDLDVEHIRLYGISTSGQ